MNSKEYVRVFIILLLLIVLGISFLNYYIDPFSAFDTQYKRWYSYGFTQNPRVAKINYLDKNFKKFDSYVVGASGSSSFPVSSLNDATGASFYNLFYYGADMLDSLNTVKYIVENYDVKNIVLPISFTNASKYNYGEDSLNDKMNYKVSGENVFNYFTKYFFANPKYSYDKVMAGKIDTYIQQNFDVFNVSTGSYDKSLKDVESISSLNAYLSEPEHQGFTLSYDPIELKYIDEFIASLEEIIEICKVKGINYKVIMVPLYYEDFQRYRSEEVEQFYEKLSNITEFWDFTNTYISYDARYFYDRTHFRNSVGEMMISKIFNNSAFYSPKDFGVYVKDGKWEVANSHFHKNKRLEEKKYSTKLPVFMFHNIEDKGDNDVTMSVENFNRQLKCIKDAGYNTVSIKEIIDYTRFGVDLPEKPVLITFDDGYESNYTRAFPLLKKYNMKACIFIIGSSVGKSNYKETNHKITPHFTVNEGREMVNSGLVEIQSHTYDMHQSKKFEKGNARENILRFSNESEKEYIEVIENDIDLENILIKEFTGNSAYAFAYPYGIKDELSSVLLNKAGIVVTVTTEADSNMIIKGLPQSLFLLNRYVLIDETSNEILERELSQ